MTPRPGQRIIRVFPRRTNATPDDELVRVGIGPGFLDEADEIHISATFTKDLPFAEILAAEWRFANIAPVKIGGPATGERGENFDPGMYVKRGYVITSRGCPNKCWFCSVWKREGEVRELPIKEGHNVLDDNLLACSDEHIRAVFGMLSSQKDVEFTGGLEAARLKDWHCAALANLKPKQLFFANDTPDDYEPLVEAGKMLAAHGFTQSSHCLRAYVLCGYPGDKMEKAEKRMFQTADAGFLPMAMLWQDKNGVEDLRWKPFQRSWVKLPIICTKLKEREAK